MTHQTSVTTERTGHCAKCSCDWERWTPDKHIAQQWADEHARKHKLKEG